ncbi:fasciclin domain-containing protein [Jannaschia sp. S6380]|uniref:fasciclin domain-containing protein n=1 Tax=Jannaschia sp. S6380 TaxID=2926408 RepID=UPI001FF496AB|nr:fasciclin domain-containing protein [Jannaschia sp. S6380]MCK0166025.1 fasciclin domain-containing protein [Jannaschia sp. S6380]
MKMKTLIAAAAMAATATGASAASIAQIASEDGRFGTLLAAVEAAGLTDTLAGPGNFTVFAPLDDAFAALPDGTVETLLQPENKGQLTDVLLYHVDDRVLTSGQIPAGSIYVKPILETARLCVTKAGGGVTIADSTDAVANVVVADIRADNGVIHVVDKVLLPGARPACH